MFHTHTWCDFLLHLLIFLIFLIQYNYNDVLNIPIAGSCCLSSRWWAEAWWGRLLSTWSLLASQQLSYHSPLLSSPLISQGYLLRKFWPVRTSSQLKATIQAGSELTWSRVLYLETSSSYIDSSSWDIGNIIDLGFLILKL